jgi:hypothetical protein
MADAENRDNWIKVPDEMVKDLDIPTDEVEDVKGGSLNFTRTADGVYARPGSELASKIQDFNFSSFSG